jgi:DNA mismatch repair protein MutS
MRVDKLGTHDAMLDETGWRPALLACELCLVYAEETGQGALPRHLRPPRAMVLESRLLLDQTTRMHLDLCGPPHDLRKRGTLLWHLDQTKTAAGGRHLLRLLLQPSAELGEIEGRLDRLQVLVDDPALRALLLEHLGGADVERLVARAANGRAGPRDLVRLQQALLRFPAIAEALFAHSAWQPTIAALGDAIEACSVVCGELGRALRPDAPVALGDERAFNDGYDAGLDELWVLQSGGQSAIAALEAREKELTGIPSLKIRFNNVFGWYLEVTRANQAKVPERYKRKQTIANGERYVTDELTALEEQVDGADGRRRRREGDLLQALLGLVATHARALLEAAAFVASVDAVVSLAEVAVAGRCVRPILLRREERHLSLEEVRHPVVERFASERGEAFVPASVVLDADRQILVVTGPNMAGKSTMMRQVALAQVLAQCGCFVPAQKATLSICDRVFTRVGASDDIASGRSTFMVEMTETSHILRGATQHSLVLLDEIGRGTSTFDGLAIAWAVAEHLHDTTGARTLFATHYHELTALDEHLGRLKNVHVVVKEWGDDIVFVRTLKDGPAGRSFGIQVARLAGLPTTVVARAKEVLAHLEGEASPPSADGAKTTLPKTTKRSTQQRPQMSLFAPAEEAAVATGDDRAARILERLRGLDLNRLTPLQALNTLAGFVDEARK